MVRRDQERLGRDEVVSGQGSHQGVVQKPLGSRGIFKYQGGTKELGQLGGQAAPEQPKPGSGSAL